MEQLRYVIYARKSTESEDKQIQSLDAQLFELRKIVKNKGLKVVKEFTESKSAKAPFKRPLFSEMLRMIEAGEADAILCWQFNRLARNPAEAGHIQQLLQDGKIKIIQTYDKAYYPDDNVIILSVESGVANQFIQDLRKNVKRGIREKLRKGEISGPAPQGYINTIDPVTRLKTVAPDPERFTTLRRAFDYYLTGNYGVNEIKKMLDDWGYTTPKRKQVGGNKISLSSLYTMLQNIRYAGYIVNPDEPDGEPFKATYTPLITIDEYEQIQRLLGRRSYPHHVTKKTFELRGLLKCGECGCSITAEKHFKKLKDGSTNTHIYYHCTKKRGHCTQRTIREDDLYQQVNELLDDYEISPLLNEWGLKALKEIANEEIKQRDTVQQLQFTSVETIQKKLDRLLDLVTDGTITSSDYQTKSAELKQELLSRQNEQQATAERVRNWYEIIGNTLDKLTNAQERFKTGDLAERRNILHAIGYNPILHDNMVSMTPDTWIIPIKEGLPAIKAELATAITKSDLNNKTTSTEVASSIYSMWYPGQELNLRP